MTKMIPLSSFEYTPNYTEKAFEEAEKFLLTLEGKEVANFAKITPKGTFDTFLGRPCHAAMSSSVEDYCLIATEALSNSKDRDVLWKPFAIDPENVIIGTSRKDRPKGVVDGFFQWFVYESLFSRFILNRDRESIKRGFIFSTDLPPAITQTLCIIGRHFYEALDRAFIKFDELVLAGVPKSVAYVTTFNCHYSYWYQPRKETDNYTPLYAHRAFAFPDSLKSLQNFAEGSCRENALTAKSYREKPDLYGAGTLFLGGGSPSGSPVRPFTYTQLSLDSELRDFLKSLRGEDAAKIPEVINPFKKVREETADPLLVSYTEMFEIIKFLNQRGDFKNAVH